MELLIDFIERCLSNAADIGHIEFFRHQAFGATMFFQELMLAQGVDSETVEQIGELWNTDYRDRFDALHLK